VTRLTTRTTATAATTLAAALALASCGAEETVSSTGQDPAVVGETSTEGIRLVTPEEGAALRADPPDDLVILDVRTPEEYGDGHLSGAVQIDFYDDDFADQLADLDTDVPYLVYCRSGNRSGQTTAIMRDLGFTDVADVDGGIIAWAEAGNPVVVE